MQEMKLDRGATPRKALLLGHFSTVGDVACLDFVTDCLRECGMPFETCAFMEEVRKNIPACLSPGELKPDRYSHLIFICGPCWPELLTRNGINLLDFSHCSRIGVNTTMVLPVQDWNPFKHLLERDSDRQSRPDLSFFTTTEILPVVGLCLIGEQSEYGERQRHKETIEMIHAVLKELNWARLDLDTKWPLSRNSTNVASPAQFYSLVQKVDLVITNRLHGLVFALKGGVPVLAVDSIAGGDKVAKQARVLGWAEVFRPEELELEKMMDAAKWCISDAGKMAARKIAREIAPAGKRLRKDLLDALEDDEVVPLEAKYGNVVKVMPTDKSALHRLKRFFRF